MTIAITDFIVLPTAFAFGVTLCLVFWAWIVVHIQPEPNHMWGIFLATSSVFNSISFWYVFLFISQQQAFADFKWLLIMGTIGAFFFSLHTTRSLVVKFIEHPHPHAQ